MSKEWTTVTLHDVGDLARGKSKHRPRWAEHLYGDDYPFVQTGDIRKCDKYVTEYQQMYSEAGLAQSKLWKKGTLCITIAANIAEIGILTFDACFPDSVLGFIPNEKKCSTDYIFYLLRVFQSRLQQLAIGSVQDNINLGTFNNIEFNLPPLAEQKAIAGILGKLDDKIELNRQMNQTLEQMAQALFQSWFVDFDPVIDNAIMAGDPDSYQDRLPEALHEKAEKRKSTLNSPPSEQPNRHAEQPHERHAELVSASDGSDNQTLKPVQGDGKLPEDLQKLFPNKFTFNDTLNKWIPEGWEVKKIGDLGKAVTGKTPSSKTPEHFGEDYAFVTPTDFKNYFKLVTKADRGLSAIGKEKNQQRILPIDSIIVTCIGSDMGKVAVNKVECMTNQQINSIIPHIEETTSSYLYNFFVSSYEFLRTLAHGGSTMPILNKSDFEGIDVLSPNIDLLKNVDSVFKSLDEKMLNNLKQTETLTQLREVLLPQLISGKLSVPEAMLAVEREK